MANIFINEKTGKKEKHYQCAGCCEWIPFSNTNHHKTCKDKNLIIQFL